MFYLKKKFSISNKKSRKNFIIKAGYIYLTKYSFYQSEFRRCLILGKIINLFASQGCMFTKFSCLQKRRKRAFPCPCSITNSSLKFIASFSINNSDIYIAMFANFANVFR